jgi:hypothetical protein
MIRTPLGYETEEKDSRAKKKFPAAVTLKRHE